MKLFISIIVPVYNTENYLERCIQSILCQTYANFELLLINDGSTDASGEICDKFALKDERIRVFHKSNGGVTSARKLGVKEAAGEFITFVDSDDELFADALHVLTENVTSENIDVVVSNLKYSDNINGDQYVKKVLCRILYNSIWGNLYRRSLLNDWVFDIPRSVNIGEDAIMNIRIGLNMNEGYAKCIPNNIYYYRENPNSVLHTRKISLEYEELYIDQLTKTLEKRLDDFRAEYYFSNLNTLENLIVCRISVDYKRTWIRELKEWYKNKHVTFRYWIVLNIRHNLLCKYILAVEKRVKNFMRNA